MILSQWSKNFIKVGFLIWKINCSKNYSNFGSSVVSNFGSYFMIYYKFFILPTKFDKNISDWSHDCTDHKNGIDFFMRLVKWPKIADKKKPNFLEMLGTKVVQFWCYTKLIKTKKLLLNWYSSMKIFFRKIRRIFEVENRLWKSDFGTF